MAFISGPDGDLKTAFVSDAWLLDQFVGNTLFCWGRNTYGQIGDNTRVNKSNPTQTVTGGSNWKQVSGGYAHVYGIKTDGTLWGFGQNTKGQLGDNTILSKSSPVQTVALGTNWKQVACGYHTAAIKTDGTLWTWGPNATYGPLGDNTVDPKSSPVQTVAFGTNWKQVSSGLYHCAAIKTDGTLWTWGQNIYGQLGNNTVANRSSPVQTIAYGTNWKQVSAGGRTTAAIKTDGTLWCWGDGDKGELGDNLSYVVGNNRKSSPIQTITFGTNWKQVSAGYFHTTAIKTDGTLWCWGSNTNGQLGDNTIVSKSSPVQTVAFGTNWKQVSAGYKFTAAIKTDGTLWTWGDAATYGQLGDNTVVAKSSPVQTTAYGTNWKQVDCKYQHIAAVTNGDI